MKNFIYKFLFFLSIVVVPLTFPKGAQISSDSFGLTFDNKNLPYSFNLNNSTKKMNVLLYSYESQKNYTYLVFDVCSTGNFSDLKVINNGYNSYFNDNSALVVRTSITCNVLGYDGSLYKLQIQVGKFSDYDSAGELYAGSYLQFKFAGKYNAFYNFSDAYLSDVDVVTPLINASNDSKKQQEIIDKQTETNEKLDDLNKTQQDTNKKLDDVKGSITSEDGPKLDGLNNSAGWLPAGPLDSILNLPLSFLQNLFTNLSKTCQPVSLPLPFVNKNLQLPCLNSIYSQIEGLSTWINTIGVIASAFILFTYLINLYKWVDDTLTFRENNYIDNWGGI